MSRVDNIHKLSVSETSSDALTEHTFPLLAGEYEAYDAEEAVLSMMRTNLQFHDILALREFEGMNDTSRNINFKKKLLEKSRSNASELIRAARQEGKKVTLEAEIKITLS